LSTTQCKGTAGGKKDEISFDPVFFFSRLKRYLSEFLKAMLLRIENIIPYGHAHATMKL